MATAAAPAAPTRVGLGADEELRLRRRVVEHLYGEDASIKAIAEALRVSAGTVLNDLRACGIESWPRGGAGHRRPGARIELRRRAVQLLYEEERLTELEIAELLRVGGSVVHKDLCALDVPRRSRGSKGRRLADLEAARIAKRRSRVAELYPAGWTGRAIGNELGVDSDTVYEDLKALGIKRRHAGWPTRYPAELLVTRVCRRPGCKELVTPKWPSHAARGWGVYCTRRCVLVDQIASWPGRLRRTIKLRLTRSPGRPRSDQRLDYTEAIARIQTVYAETHASEREVARLSGESRRMVRIALDRPV